MNTPDLLLSVVTWGLVGCIGVMSIVFVLLWITTLTVNTAVKLNRLIRDEIEEDVRRAEMRASMEEEMEAGPEEKET